MTTPPPTGIEEARKMADALLVALYGNEAGLVADAPYVSAFIAAIELGERRADAAHIEMERASVEAFNQALMQEADALERRDHRSKPACPHGSTGPCSICGDEG